MRPSISRSRVKRRVNLQTNNLPLVEGNNAIGSDEAAGGPEFVLILMIKR